MKKLSLPAKEEQDILLEKEIKTSRSPLIWIVILSALAVILLYIFRDKSFLITESHNNQADPLLLLKSKTIYYV